MEPNSPAQCVSFNNEDSSIAIEAGVYNNHGTTTVNLNHDDLLGKLPQAIEAPFNAYNKQHEPTCHPATRTAILDEIYHWANGQDEPCVYWLSGLAGTGKSTIARTVAHRHHEDGSLGASFFFSRGRGDVGHARKFVTSIAAQLARHIRTTRKHICKVVAEHDDISTLSLHDQWRKLILNPLSVLNSSDGITSITFVIDALDECDDDRNIRIVIELLEKAQALSDPRLRVFLTSRFKPAIRFSFGCMPKTSYRSFQLQLIPKNIVDADIELFLKQNLVTVGQLVRLPDGWLDPGKLAQMVQRASGLFIWAATAHRFVEQGGYLAGQRLELIIKQDGDSPVEPEKHLDSIYLTVLRASLSADFTAEEKEKYCKILRLLLGTLAVLREPLTVQELGKLLDISNEGVRLESIVQGLHAILDMPEDGDRALNIHHPSLRDFLLDFNRCTDTNFFVHAVDAQRALTWKCMELMKRYFEQEEWKHGTARSKLDEEVYGKRSCPAEMEYACRNWVRHLQRSGSSFPGEDQARIFIEEHAVNWAIMLLRWHDGPIPTDDILELEHWLSALKPTSAIFIGDVPPAFGSLIV